MLALTKPIMDIGHTTGPLISGIMAAGFGYAFSFLTAALVLLAITLLFFLLIGLKK